MLQRLRAVLPETGANLWYECRHCGQTLQTKPSHCPTCQADEIATYHL